MRVFIIAEAGVNHNGSIETAKKLIDVAADAGADAVKFQTFKAGRLVTGTAAKATYQIENTGTNEPQLEMLKRLELSLDMHKELMSYCKEKNIMFMSTPFDEESADILDELEVSIFKIPSGEITNKLLVQHIAAKNKSIILSTGMSYLGEIEKAIGWIYEIWDKLGSRPQLTLLHCVSNYPAAVEDINLSAMRTMSVAFGLPVGYSDHTMGVEVPVAAVAMGAQIIEKHFTLNRNMEGPDHKASLEADELQTMINMIRNVEKMIGDGIKRPSLKEEEARRLIRRSLVAARDIKKGEVIDKKGIAVKRPGYGISPALIEDLAGKTAKKDIQKDSVLRWDDF
jgi:N-acetylneuraminate synthase